MKILRSSTRREFLRTVGLAAGAGALGAAAPRIGFAQPPAVGVRRSIASLDPRGPEVAAYRAGVAAMKCRSAGDPTSWIAQGQIHYDFCPHSNWFFLPWHRAYLLYFEQICRAASGDSSFMLPYWDWTTQPEIPAAFWGCSDLFDCSREAGPTDQVSAEFVGPEVIREILAISDFVTFASAPARATCQPPGGMLQRKRCGSGRLEATPHNQVHNFVSGNMASYWSPLDPIFWLHHANVDRLWTEWNKAHANTGDPAWLDFVFEENFFEPRGNPVDAQVSGLLDTYALGYRYETQDPTPRPGPREVGAPAVEQTLAELPNEQAARSEAPLGVVVRPNDALTARLRTLLERGSRSPARATLRLELEGIEEPGAPTAVRVYLNHPAPSLATSIAEPQYVGTFTFFSQDGVHSQARGHHAGATTYLLDLTETVTDLGRAGRMAADSPLEVKLLPVALDRTSREARATPAAITPSRVRITWVEG
jgi:tyrosinase